RGVRGDVRNHLQLRRPQDHHRWAGDQLRRRGDPRTLRRGRARRGNLLVQLPRRLRPDQWSGLWPDRRSECRKGGYCGGLTPSLLTATRGVTNLPSPSTLAPLKIVSPGFRSARVPGAKVTISVSL